MATLQVFDEFINLKVTQPQNRDAALAPKVQGELQIWLSEVLLAGPNEALTRLLRVRGQNNHRVTSVLNQANALIAAAFPQLVAASTKAGHKGQKTNRGLAASASNSQQQNSVQQPPVEDSSKKRMLCLSLYKFCLHRVLLLSLEGAAASLKLPAVSELPELAQHLALDSVLEETEHLAGLVQACAEIVTFAHLTNVSESFPTCSLRMGRKTQWIELLQGLTWMRHSRKSLRGASQEEGMLPGLLEFPVQLGEYILAIENKILSELLFVPGSTFFPRVQEHGIYKPPAAGAANGASSPGEDSYTTSVKVQLSAATVTPEDVKNGMKRTANTIVLTTTLKKFCRLAEQKAQDLCHHLWTHSDISSACLNETTAAELENALQSSVSAMFNALMYRHLDLMYNRHLTVIVIGIVCCAAKICGFKVKFPAVMKVAMSYFNEDINALSEVSLDPLLSMKWAGRKIKKDKEKKEKKNGSGGGGGGGGGGDSETESEEGWSSSDGDDDDDFSDSDDVTDIEMTDMKSGAVGSAKEFYNKVMVPLVTLYVNADDGTVTELLGATQEQVLEALDAAGGAEIILDACKLYPAKGGTGSSQQTIITNATSTDRNQRQTQSQQQHTTPSKPLLNVSHGGGNAGGAGGGAGGMRSKAKKPESRTPLAALKQKKKK